MTQQSQLATLFSYHWHTTKRMIESAALLPDSEYHDNSGVERHSVHELLFHVLRTDCAWRIALETGRQSAPIEPEQFSTLEAIRAGFLQEQAAWGTLLDSLSDEHYEQAISLINWRGDSVTFMRWRVLQHLILHGMQHHAEIAQLLTLKGQSPGDIDFVFYQG